MLAKYLIHIYHVIRYWSMSTLSGLYLMNKEQKVGIIKDFERKSEGVIPFMNFTIRTDSVSIYLKPSSLLMHLSQKVSACLIQPWQSWTVADPQTTGRRGVKVSALSSGFFLMLLFIFDQHFLIGFKKESKEAWTKAYTLSYW